MDISFFWKRTNSGSREFLSFHNCKTTVGCQCYIPMQIECNWIVATIHADANMAHITILHTLQMEILKTCVTCSHRAIFATIARCLQSSQISIITIAQNITKLANYHICISRIPAITATATVKLCTLIIMFSLRTLAYANYLHPPHAALATCLTMILPQESQKTILLATA
jgi:hypothetical protein